MMNRIIYLLLSFFIATGVCVAQKKVAQKIKKPLHLKIQSPPQIIEPTIKYDESAEKKNDAANSAPDLPGTKIMDIDLNTAPAEKRSNEFNKYSNNQVLTKDDIILNNLTHEVDAGKKINSNALLIYGVNGKVLSFDLTNQSLNWSYIERGIKSSGSNKFSIDGAALYVPYADGTLTALDINTGSVYWKDKIGLEQDKNLLTRQNAIINKDLLFVAARNSNLYAINKQKGTMAWNYRLQYEYNIYPPVVANEDVYINNAPFIYNFEAQTGKPVWQRGFNKAMYATMVADEKHLYATNENNILFAVNPNATSSIDWEFNLSDNQYGVGENIVLNNGVIYLAGKANPDSKASSIYGINAADGKQLWKTDLAKNEVLSMNLIDDQIFGYMKDSLFIIDPKDGNLVFSVKPPEGPISNFIKETENTILYVSQNGLVRFSKTDKSFKLIAIPELKTEETDSKATIQLVTKNN